MTPLLESIKYFESRTWLQQFPKLLKKQQKRKSDHMLRWAWWLAIYYALHLKSIDHTISIQNVVLRELQKPQ